jgi:hypothetical protein
MKEQLFERRGNLLEALADVVKTQTNLKNSLARLEKRIEPILEDLQANAQELNKILEAEARKKRRSKGKRIVDGLYS